MTMAQERIHELDILRGFALLGVFIVHFVGLTFYELPVPPGVRQAWESDSLQRGVSLFSDIFFQSKANTLFATLFGMSFWLMLQRLTSSSVGFNVIYLRRLSALAMMGLLHLILIFPGDVLFEYACLGFVLFSLRWLPPIAMLILGITLAIVGHPLGSQISAWLGHIESQPAANIDLANEHYLAWVLRSAREYYNDEIAYAGSLDWLLYLFGRFLIGAWIMQQAWTRSLSSYRHIAMRVALISLPIGIALETLSILVAIRWIPWPMWIDTVTHAIGAPLVAIGYATGLIALFASATYKPWVIWLAPVGRIALTAYVTHGLVFSLLFLPLGPSYAGTITPLMGLIIAVGLYIILTLWSQYWLREHRYGPLEYVWRWATYGSRPRNSTN